ncbi:TetR/AcrR family transcriptional regulator C-terminal ligand-binding domain-containing protein [Streptomyces sp. NPDC056716]|uniref:TetR/AcrR family transcriptional regulator n=1 Tax=unclassified Streptomyces TaxID=2593676 RepID=UPI0036A17909
MTSQAADRPEAAGVSRRSKLTPEREREFYDAVLDQLRQCGYDAVTMEGIAASTRCSKSTLYRQWKTKPRFVAAALRANRRVRFSGIDTGSLAGDLIEAGRAAGEVSADDTRLFQALGHAVVQDKQLARALHEAVVEPEVAALREIVCRGVARGEVSAGHPALEYVPVMMLGVLRARPVLENRHADQDYLVRFVEVAVLPALGLTPPGRVPAPRATGTGVPGDP